MNGATNDSLKPSTDPSTDARARHGGRLDGFRSRLHKSLGVTCLVLLAASAAAADFDLADGSWSGASELLGIARARIGPERVALVAELDFDKLRPADGVLILHPETAPDIGALSEFMQAGGRVALLDDFGSSDLFLERFGIQRLGRPLEPAQRLRGDDDLPIAVPAPAPTPNGTTGSHPVVQAVDQLMLNHATSLSNPGLTPFLVVPSRVAGRDALVGVTGLVGREHPGRLLVVSDGSVVINTMLRYPGNRHFAEALSSYLVEDEGTTKRSGKLYLLSNRFSQRGTFGAGLDVGTRLRQRGERLFSMLHEGLPDALILALAAVAGLVVFGWARRNAWLHYARVRPHYLAPTPTLAQGGLAGRAAVLAAPSTHPTLALLELRASLLEGLSEHLRLHSGPSREALLHALQTRALSPDSLARVRSLLTELDAIESSFAAGQVANISNATVTRLHRYALDIFAELGDVSHREASS